MKKILISFGTRPEAIKMCPIVHAFHKRDDVDVRVCITGQHREMLQQVLDVFNVVPDYDLDIMKKGQDLYDITIVILERIRTVLREFQPDVVLVHGDTTSAFVVSLACFYERISIAHVEAGLRTYNLDEPYPEEFNRHAISIISKWNFAPTELARKNLLAERVSENCIYVTGNTVIDAINMTTSLKYSSRLLEWVGDDRLILVTAHRRENWGAPLNDILDAIYDIAIKYPNVKFIYPVHLNPNIQKVAKERLSGMPNVRLVDPLDVLEFHNILTKCYFVLTDSGGIQEEASAVCKPVLVLRNTTERPEGVEAGILKLVGTNKNKIVDECISLLENSDIYTRMCNSRNPYGDGTASEKIVDILCSEEG